MRQVSKITGLFMIFLFIIFLLQPVQAENPRKVVMIVVNRVSAPQMFEEFNLKNLAKVRDTGAIGLMNLRTVGAPTPEKICLAINAGSPVNYLNLEGGHFFAPDEIYDNMQAAVLYERNFPQKITSDNLINPEFNLIKNQNMNGDFLVAPGLLGDSLHNAKPRLFTACWGNSDTDSLTPKRLGAIIATDGNGVVDYGKSGTGPRKGEIESFNAEAAIKWYKGISGRASFVVFDFGDFSRLDDWSSYLAPERYEQFARKACENFDHFLGLLMAEIDFNHTLLLIVAPTPPQNLLNSAERLSPVIIKGPKFTQGLLRSVNTRTDGLITPYNLTATILDFLNIKESKPVTGDPLVIKKASRQRLLKYYRTVTAIEAQRNPGLAGFVYTLVILVIFSTVLYFFGGKQTRIIYGCQFLLLAVMVFPLALMLAAHYFPWQTGK